MMVIKVELWPGGHELGAREIGRLGLANVSDLNSISNYVGVLAKDDGSSEKLYVAGHPRSAGFEPLVAALLDNAAKDIPEAILEKHADDFESVARIMGPLASRPRWS